MMDRNYEKRAQKKANTQNVIIMYFIYIDVKQTGLDRSSRKTGCQTSILLLSFFYQIIHKAIKNDSKLSV